MSGRLPGQRSAAFSSKNPSRLGTAVRCRRTLSFFWCDELARHPQQQRHGCDLLDLDLCHSRQPIAKRDAGSRSWTEFDADVSIADFASHIGHGCGQATVLRPRKGVEPETSRLALMNSAEGYRRAELRDHLQTAGRYDDPELFAG